MLNFWIFPNLRKKKLYLSVLYICLSPVKSEIIPLYSLRLLCFRGFSVNTFVHFSFGLIVVSSQFLDAVCAVSLVLYSMIDKYFLLSFDLAYHFVFF